jgi:conjugal transfer ATP-binding protein TraC
VAWFGKLLQRERETEEIPPVLKTGAREFVDRVAPSGLQIGRDDVAMPTQGVFTRTWWVEDLPETLVFESLDPILHFPGRVTVSMLVDPIPPAEAAQALRQERSSRYAGFITRGQQGRLSDPGEAADLQSFEKEYADLRIARRYPMSLYWVIGVSAHDEEELEDLGQKMEELLLTSGLVFHQATWRHEAALKSLLPLGINFLGDRRNVNANTMACLFPFSRRVHYSPGGLPYGIDRNSGAWVIFDDWECDVQNMLVLGEMRSGKSMFLKWHTLWHVLLGGRVFAIDLEGEFEPLARLLDAEYIDLGLASDEKINVLDINPDDDEGYYTGATDLLGWLGLAVGGLTPNEANAVRDAYRRIMADAGVKQEIRSSWRKSPREMPVLSDLYTALMVEEHTAARDVAARLKEYAVGMYANAFNSRTTIDPRSPLVVFDVSRVRSEALKALRMRQIVTFIWSRMMRGDTPTRIVVDEAWHWLRHPQASVELEEMARRLPKRYGGLQLGTQHVYDLASNVSAEVIRDTVGSALLFRQRGSAVKAVAGLFDLNDLEADELRVLTPGEALLVSSDHRIPLYVAIPPDLLRLFSTRPQDRVSGERGGVEG